MAIFDLLLKAIYSAKNDPKKLSELAERYLRSNKKILPVDYDEEINWKYAKTRFEKELKQQSKGPLFSRAYKALYAGYGRGVEIALGYSYNGERAAGSRSSWIDSAMWIPVNGNYGILKIWVAHKGEIKCYTFGEAGYGRVYPMVHRATWDAMKFSMSVGTKFWRLYYGIYSLQTGRISSWKGLGEYKERKEWQRKMKARYGRKVK